MTKTASWLALLAWLLVTSITLAAAGKGGGIVLVVEGVDTDAVRTEVIDTLPAGLHVQNPDDVRSALSNQGITLLTDSLASPRTRKQTLVGCHKAMKELNAPALIAVRVKRGRGGARELRVVLVTNDQTEPVVDEDLVLSRTERSASKLTALLHVPLEEIRPPPEDSPATSGRGRRGRRARGADREAAEAPAPKEAREEPREREPKEKETREREPKERAPKEKEAKEKEPEPAEESEAPQRDAVAKKRPKLSFANAMAVLEVAAEMGSRKLEYNQPTVGPLRGYLAPAMAAYALSVQFYPGANTGIAGAKDIGVVVRYANALGLESKTADGTQSVRTSWSRSAIGVRGRMLTGAKPDSPSIGLEGTYCNSSFIFDGLDPVIAEVPSVRYQFIRAGIDGRVPFGAASVYGGLGYMHILSAGEFSDRFVHASIAGVDGRLGAGYAFLPWMEARADASYTRVFSSANPELGDAYVAGGALDQYFVWHVGVAAIF